MVRRSSGAQPRTPNKKRISFEGSIVLSSPFTPNEKIRNTPDPDIEITHDSNYDSDYDFYYNTPIANRKTKDVSNETLSADKTRQPSLQTLGELMGRLTISVDAFSRRQSSVVSSESSKDSSLSVTDSPCAKTHEPTLDLHNCMLRGQGVGEISKEEEKHLNILIHVLPLCFNQHCNKAVPLCAATTAKGLQCMNLARFPRSPYSNTGNYLNDIDTIIDHYLCTSHRNIAQKSLDQYRPLFKKLPTSLTQNHPEKDHCPTNPKLSALIKWLKAIDLYKPDPTDNRPKTPDLYRSFTPYTPSKRSGRSARAMIQATITKSLKPTETKSGYIYVFKDIGHPGHVKIGRTNDIKIRLGTHERECQRHIELCFPKESDHAVAKAPNIKRVEELIHNELIDFRKQTKCGCGKKHAEWFEMSVEIAVAITREWMVWMRKGPYRRNVDDGCMVVKEEMAKEMDGRPDGRLPDLSTEQFRTPPSWAKRKSKRVSDGGGRESSPLCR